MEREKFFGNFCALCSGGVSLDLTLNGGLAKLGLAGLILGLSLAEHGAHDNETDESKEEEDEEDNEEGLGSSSSLSVLVGLGVDSVNNLDNVLTVERLRRTVVTAPLGEESAILLGHLVLNGLDSRLGDGDDLLGNIEERKSSAGRRREGTLVGPTVVPVDLGVQVVNSGTHVEILLFIDGDPLGEEGISGGLKAGNARVVVLGIEDQGERGTESFNLLGGGVSGVQVNHVHLELEKLAVDGMLGRMMNVELERVPHGAPAL